MRCIYAIINLKTGKKYIGSTSNFARRIKKHKYLLEKGTHHSVRLQNSYHKHGKEWFIYTPIKLLDGEDDIRKEEQYFIDTLKVFDKKFGYNISKSSESPVGHNQQIVYQYNFNGELLDQFDNCIKAAEKIGCDCSGLSKCARGKYSYYAGYIWVYDPLTLEERLLKYQNRGKRSDETKLKQSLLKLGKNLKPIYQLDMEENIIKEWPSTTELCKIMGYSNGYISDALNGKHTSAYGFKWKFK